MKKRKLKYIMIHYLPNIILAVFIIIIAVGLYNCPVNAIFNIPCPGCGMTRAYLSLLKLDFKAALHYHCLFPIPIFWVGYQIIRKHIEPNSRFENILLILSVFLFIIRWIIILIIYY